MLPRPKNLLRITSRTFSRLFGAGQVLVLTYHRILESTDNLRPGETTAAEFEAQMKVVSKSFPTMTFGSFIRQRRAGECPDGSIVVTFDDGYRDNHDIALPILRKYGVLATFFVASGFVDGGMMWNDKLIESMRRSVGRKVDLRAAGLGQVRLATVEDASRAAKETLSTIKRWPAEQRSAFVDDFARAVGFDPDIRLMMNADELSALAAAGMEIGAHTISHPILSTLSPDKARVEIVQCKSTLEKIVGQEIQSFAYPNGSLGTDFTQADVERVRDAGYLGAATTRWGTVVPHDDNFLIPRQSLWGSNPYTIWSRLIRNFAS